MTKAKDNLKAMLVDAELAGKTFSLQYRSKGGVPHIGIQIKYPRIWVGSWPIEKYDYTSTPRPLDLAKALELVEKYIE